VATHEQKLPRLEQLYQQGLERLREIETYAFGIKALHSPTTGIVDYGQVASAFAQRILSRGGEILTGHQVIAIEQRSVGCRLMTPSHVISCAGLYADRMAWLAGSSNSARIVPFRGDYYPASPAAQRHAAGIDLSST